jgi:hypothetical protein
MAEQCHVQEREADSQANSEDCDNPFLPHSISQAEQNVQASVHPESLTDSYAKSPPNPPRDSPSPYALPSRETDEREDPEKTRKIMFHHQVGIKDNNAGDSAAPGTISSSYLATLVESIGLLNAKRDKILRQLHQQNDEDSGIHLKYHARWIQLEIERRRRVLERSHCHVDSGPAQAPEEGKEYLPSPTAHFTLPNHFLRREKSWTDTLPIDASSRAQDGLETAPCEPAAEDKPAVSPRRVQEEPSSHGERERPEDEWTEIKLEDAEVPLGREEWVDDIVSSKIPNGARPKAWWLKTKNT